MSSAKPQYGNTGLYSPDQREKYGYPPANRTGYSQGGNKGGDYNDAPRSAYKEPAADGYKGTYASDSKPNKPHHGDATHKKKCICPLYAYRRYDKIDPVHIEGPHYPANLKTIYTKDYTPKRADKNKMDFSPIRTLEKSKPMRDNYLTTQKKDYTPKQARSTTPIRAPEHNYNRDVPFKGKTEYFDMTKDANDQLTYSPVRAHREKYRPTVGPKENTEYHDEFTPKKNSTARTALPEDDAIFRGSTYRKVGPMQDKTIYRGDYTPKPLEKDVHMDNGIFKGSNWDIRPKMFDGLTIYKKDYVGPEMYYCECPDGEESHHH